MEKEVQLIIATRQRLDPSSSMLIFYFCLRIRHEPVQSPARVMGENEIFIYYFIIYIKFYAQIFFHFRNCSFQPQPMLSQMTSLEAIYLSNHLSCIYFTQLPLHTNFFMYAVALSKTCKHFHV